MRKEEWKKILQLPITSLLPELLGGEKRKKRKNLCEIAGEMKIILIE